MHIQPRTLITLYTCRFIQKQGLDRTFVECENHMWRIGTRPLPPDVTLDGGSDWIVINRNYSHYLVTNTEQFLTGLKKYYEYSLLPAEVHHDLSLPHARLLTHILTHILTHSFIHLFILILSFSFSSSLTLALSRSLTFSSL